MLSERDIDLINRATDGELSGPEEAEFAALIKDSEEARAYSDRLAELASLLHTVPLAEPPADLRGRILSRVQLPRPRHWFTKFAGWMQGRPLHHALAATAGLMLAVGFYEMVPGPHEDSDYSSLVGTLARGERLQGVAELDDLDIDLPGIQGRVSVSGSDDLRLLRLDVETVEEATFRIDLGNSGLSFGGFAQEAATGTDNFRYSDNRLNVSNAGAQQFTVILKDAAKARTKGEIVISVSQGGEAVYEGVLRP